MSGETVEFSFNGSEGTEKEKFHIEVEGVEGRVNVLDPDEKKEPEEKPKKKPIKAGDYEIEVEDDTPPEDRDARGRRKKPSDPPQEVTDDELSEYSDKVKKRIQHLNRGYHDERRAKEAALREREELERLAAAILEENKQLKGTVSKTQNTVLEQAKRTAQVEYEAAKKAFREAYETGDGDKVLEAQEKMQQAQIRLDRVTNFKPAPLQPEKTQVKQEQAQPKAAPARDAKAESWAKENAWFGSDDEMTAYALGLHNKLVKQGVDPKSDEYYEAINARMRQVFPDQFDGDEDIPEVPEARPRTKSVVAPASRGKAPKKITLTQTQVKLAKRLGVPLELYAQKVAEQMRNEQ